MEKLEYNFFIFGKRLIIENMKNTKRNLSWYLNRNQKYVGIHLIADFWGAKIIEDSKKIEAILLNAAKAGKNKPLKVVIYKFPYQGITGIVLLKESHIAIHSWPEIDYLAIDIFTCGKKSLPYEALKYLKEEFTPRRIIIKEIKRGKIEDNIKKI